MKKTNEIKAVSFFEISNGFVYFKKDTSFNVISDGVSKILFEHDNIYRVIFWESEYILLDDLNNPICYSNSNFFLEIQKKSGLRLSKILGNFIVYYVKKPVFMCGLFDIIRQEFNESNKNHFEYYFQSNFYSTLDHKVTALNKSTPLWQYELPKIEYSLGSNYPPAVSKEIATILGIYADILWIVSDMGHLMGLDTQTGECKYHLKTPINLSEIWAGWEVFIPAKRSFIDTEKGIIFGLDHVHYWECDLNNPTETYFHFDISDTNAKNNIVPDLLGNWQNEEIYFGQNSFAQDATHVGIFNRKTRQITWTSRGLGEDGIFKGISKIEYQNNRLYVLDRASTLHIFER